MSQVFLFLTYLVFDHESLLACSLYNKKGHQIDVLEATVGFEPTNEGFANLCLTTWPRRLADMYYTYLPYVFKPESASN